VKGHQHDATGVDTFGCLISSAAPLPLPATTSDVAPRCPPLSACRPSVQDHLADEALGTVPAALT